MAMNSNYFSLPLNFDRVCRVCLTENTDMTPIFCSSPEVEQLSGLSQKIKLYGSIEIEEEDGLPSFICNECIFKANVAHEFRQLCQQSDARLRLYYNKPLKTDAMRDQEEYNEKEEQHILTEMSSSTGVFVQEPIVPINQDTININEQKLFVCNLQFEGAKGNESITEDLVNAINTDSLDDNIISTEADNTIENSENIRCSDEITTDIEINPEIHKIEVVGKTEINTTEDYIDQNSLSQDLEQTSIPPKRTSSRKVKSVQNTRSFSDDEIGDDYFEEESESQDSEGSKFKCKVCSKRYTTRKGLKKHFLVHDKKNSCNVCSKSSSKLDNLDKHDHITKARTCHSCRFSFSKAQDLVEHLKSHPDKVNDNIKECSNDKQNGIGDCKRESKSDDETENENSGSNELDEFGNIPGLFKCDTCGQYCSTLKNLKRHSLIHGEKKYSCFVCKKCFFRADTLKKHAEKHGHGLLDNLTEDNRLYDSDDESSTNPPTRKSFADDGHSKKDDSEEDASGKYKCQHCDKFMATKKGLKRHVSMHKPRVEPVTCEICKKICASPARLANHQKTHNKPKEKIPREYLCHICSKVYPSNSSLTYHMRTHTGVKPHVCKICNSGFTTTTSLANHIRIHTGDKPFVCHVCSAAFAVSSAFRRHLTRHTGEANYLCKTCGKAFKRLSTLKEHTYTHSGEKPYVCKTCGAAYSHSGSLFAHQKRCRVQYAEQMIVDDYHHSVAHQIHVNNVQSAVRSLTVIGQIS